MAGGVIIVREEDGWGCDRRGGRKVAEGVIVVRGEEGGWGCDYGEEGRWLGV